MSEVFSVVAVIDRPVDQVWERLTDCPRAAQWMPGVEAVRAHGETAAGTELTVRARGKDRTSRITAYYDAGRTMTLTSVQGGVRADYRYRCEPEGAATRVSLRADCEVSGVWRLAGGIIRGAIRRADSGQLAALEQAITSTPDV